VSLSSAGHGRSGRVNRVSPSKHRSSLDCVPTVSRPSPVLFFAAAAETRQPVDASASSHLEALHGLTGLDLSNTAIGDDGLARLARLPNLRRLYVNETNVTPEAVAAFRAQHPAVIVSSGARPAPRLPLSPGKPNAR